MTSPKGKSPADRISVNPEQPYLGLLSFREQDRDFFHGRNSEIEDLLRLVRRDVLTVLFGISGLGKTSLLNAGLFPKLREAMYLPVQIRLDFGAGRAGLVRQIRDRVAEEIESHCVDTPPPSEQETLWEYFHRTHFWNERNRLLRPILVFDQFEELFTLGRGDDRVAPFLQELSDLIENHIPIPVRARMEETGEELPFSYDQPNVKVVFSLREDYLAHLEELRHSIPSLSRNRYRLTRMDGERALDAVLKPGEHLLTREVAGNIVRFAAGAAEKADLKELEVEPALLSLVCRELNSQRLESHLSKISSELLSGSKERIISRFYENNISGLDPGVRVFVEEHLLTTTGFRSTKALVDALQLPGVSKEAIDTLVNKRLLRLEDRLGSQHVELIHDVLAGVIQESRQRRHEKEAVAERERAAWERRIKLGRRVLYGLAFGCIALGIFAFVQYREAEVARSKAVAEAKRANYEAARANDETQKATSRELARASMTFTEVNPVLSLILAREAVNKAGTSQALGALHRAMVVSQLRHNLQGHQRSVRDVAYSLDGQWVATASDDRTARLWHAKTGEERLPPLEGHTRGVTAVAFSPDSRWLATASTDTTAKLWDVETGQERYSLKGHKGRVTALAFSPDSKWLATASSDKTTRVWDVEAGEERLSPLEGHRRGVTAVAFSPDSKWLATASTDTTAKLWDAETGQERHSLKGHKGRVTALAFSPDSKWLATASSDKTTRLWDVDAGEERLPPLEEHTRGVTAVAFSPDGTRLATGGSDRTMFLYDRTSREVLHAFKDLPGPVSEVAFSPDQTRLAAASGNEARVWHSESNELLFTLSGHTGNVMAIAFSPDGRRLATGSRDKTAKLWNVQHNEELPTLIGHRGSISAIAYSPDGKLLATASDDKTVKVWNTETGIEVDLLAHDEKVTGVDFSPDNRSLATSSTDNIARIWDLASGEESLRLEGHEGAITAVDISPDGHWAATSSKDGTARLWEITGNDEAGDSIDTSKIINAPKGAVLDVTFSPDGKSLATANGDGTVTLWDTISVEEIGSYSVGPEKAYGRHLRAQKVAISQNGNLLAATMSDRTVRVWDLKTGEERFVLKGHRRYLSDIAFNLDGSVLATASHDETVKVWDVESGQERFTLTGYSGPVTSLAFRPHGTPRLATGSNDGNIHRYTFDVAELKRLSRDRITRKLTDTECRGFLRLSECQVAHLVKEGRKYARAVQLKRAIDTFKHAQELEPSLKFDGQPDAQSYAKALAANALDEKAKRYAREGNVNSAIKSLQRAQQYDPKIETKKATIDKIAALAWVHKGRDLAGKGDANGAIAAFTEALKINPASRVDPEKETAKGLLRKGRALARTGKIDVADRLFRTAIKLNLEIGIDPEKEVAKGLRIYGQRLARDGQAEDALQVLRKALEVDQTLTIRPEAEVAKGLVNKGRDLVRRGNLEDATKMFELAKGYHRFIEVNIKKETAMALVRKGVSDVKAGRVDEAKAALEKAQAQSPDVITAKDRNSLCWFGTLWGKARDVIDECEKAVEMTGGKKVSPRDSRGVALAVTGNLKGAIEDFTYYVDYGKSERKTDKRIEKRKEWIKLLGDGENPFTPSFLKALLRE